MSPIVPLLVFGTRPEAIKMAPVALQCAARDDLRPIVCVTGQHREMLAGVLDHFGVAADETLNLMRPDQSLADLTGRLLSAIDEVIARRKPDCVVAQGDTVSVVAASLAAFYRRVPLVHVEAGLRTGNLNAPWPEELNRRVVSVSASLHCAPTQRAAETLAVEGIPKSRIRVTGNTVVDALLWTIERERGRDAQWRARYAFLGDAPLMLVTGHRRENFGAPLASLCQALVELAARFPQAHVIYPVHLNPNVDGPVRQALSGRQNIHLTPPVPYGEFVWLLDRCRLIVTDSGGIQEEAPSLGKPVLVMRESTERPEALATGLVELVGADTKTIVARAAAWLADDGVSKGPSAVENPFGDGRAAERIAQLIAERAWLG